MAGHAPLSGADHVQPAVAAPGIGARALRRLFAAFRGPCCGTVPATYQAPDDRMVGPRHSRILRQHRSARGRRSEEHTSELQSLMRISYAVFCLKKKTI